MRRSGFSSSTMRTCVVSAMLYLPSLTSSWPRQCRGQLQAYMAERQRRIKMKRAGGQEIVKISCSVGRVQPVADAGIGDEVARARGIWLDFVAELPDED